MKLKEGFLVRKIGDDYIAVPVDDRIADFKGIVALNEVSAFILNHMESHITEDELVELLLGEYDIDKETAAADLKRILQQFTEFGMLEL